IRSQAFNELHGAVDMIAEQGITAESAKALGGALWSFAVAEIGTLAPGLGQWLGVGGKTSAVLRITGFVEGGAKWRQAVTTGVLVAGVIVGNQVVEHFTKGKELTIASVAWHALLGFAAGVTAWGVNKGLSSVAAKKTGAWAGEIKTLTEES